MQASKPEATVLLDAAIDYLDYLDCDLRRACELRSGRITMRKEYDFRTGHRGAITPASPGKTRITIRLDDDVLDWFRGQVDDAGGGNYQTLINEALRKFITIQDQPIEEIFRKVLRQELHRADAGRKPRSRKAA